jgi:hypothetical protein
VEVVENGLVVHGQVKKKVQEVVREVNSDPSPPGSVIELHKPGD